MSIEQICIYIDQGGPLMSAFATRLLEYKMACNPQILILMQMINLVCVRKTTHYFCETFIKAMQHNSNHQCNAPVSGMLHIRTFPSSLYTAFILQALHNTLLLELD